MGALPNNFSGDNVTKALQTPREPRLEHNAYMSTRGTAGGAIRYSGHLHYTTFHKSLLLRSSTIPYYHNPLLPFHTHNTPDTDAHNTTPSMTCLRVIF